MYYIGEFIYWLMMGAAGLMILRGVIGMCSKRAMYPGDVFKKIEVTDIRKYNALNGILLIGLGIIFLTAALVFKNGSSKVIVLAASACAILGTAVAGLEKKIEQKYVVMK